MRKKILKLESVGTKWNGIELNTKKNRECKTKKCGLVWNYTRINVSTMLAQDEWIANRTDCEIKHNSPSTHTYRERKKEKERVRESRHTLEHFTVVQRNRRKKTKAKANSMKILT